MPLSSLPSKAKVCNWGKVSAVTHAAGIKPVIRLVDRFLQAWTQCQHTSPACSQSRS